MNSILPVQIIRLGEACIAAVAGEPTTQAGRRIERTLTELGGQHGIKDVWSLA